MFSISSLLPNLFEGTASFSISSLFNNANMTLVGDVLIDVVPSTPSNGSILIIDWSFGQPSLTEGQGRTRIESDSVPFFATMWRLIGSWEPIGRSRAGRESSCVI